MKKLEFFLLLSFLSVSVLAQTRRALVIGLGEQKDPSWCKINGDKDVPYVEAMLNNAGYKDIRVLVNKQATKASIVQAFKDMTYDCKTGDMIYVHFSGHGQQVTDVNGDEQDGWDEAWIPYDAYLTYCNSDKGEKHLTDDELNVLLTAIKNKIGYDGKILVVVDACHSGGSTYSYNNRFLMTEDFGEIIRGVKDEFIIPGSHNGKAPKMKEQWLTLSACKDFQLNQEIKHPQVGKLTYSLYSLSREGVVSMKAIEGFMAKYKSRLPQTPMLTGDKRKHKISEFLK